MNLPARRQSGRMSGFLIDMDDSTLLRYNRQIMLPDVGIEGQQALIDSTALIVGLGGLGSPVSMYLAASGVGRLVVTDIDEVDLSNLQRQIVHHTASVGRSKVDSAVEGLTRLNPQIEIVGIDGGLSGTALDDHVAAAHVVIDATDNFDIRFELNKACLRHATPMVSGAVIRMEGQVAVYRPGQGDSPCFRCLYAPEDEPQERCSETGVLGPVAGVIGCMQAVEALKVITGVGNSLVGRLLLFDAAQMQWQEIILPKDPHCPVCSA